MKKLASLFLCILYGCGSIQHKKEADYSALSPASKYLQQGSEDMKHWRNNGPQTVFSQAETLLTKAHKLRPDDINIQYAYYDLRFTKALVNGYFEQEATLLELYKSLHPIPRNELAPPAILQYYFSNFLKKHHSVILSHLIRAVQQNPNNAQTWVLLSNHYLERGLHWLALSSAKKAYTIAPQNSFYANKMGVIYSLISDNKNCASEEKSIIQQASKYFVQAVKLDPNNPDYLSNTALQYLHLGLIPLAYSQAQKAYKIDPSPRITVIYAHLALLLGKPDAARSAMKHLQKEQLNEALQKHTWALDQSRHINYALDISDKLTFKTLLNAPSSNVNSEQYSSSFFQLHSPLLLNIESETHTKKLSHIPQKHFRSPLLKKYLTPHLNISDKELINSAKNKCDKSDFYFAIANNALTDNDIARARAMIELVIKEKDYGSKHFTLAKTIKNSPWFFER